VRGLVVAVMVAAGSSASDLHSPMARVIRRRSRMKTASITTRRVIRPTKCRLTERWTGSTYSGYRRYHADCHVCHGPDGEGSSYGPALRNSLKTMSYADYSTVVVNGRKNVNTAQENVMPAFGTNRNVMCYFEDIFIYLRARANDAVARGRPQKHDDKPKSATQAEDSCLGHGG
jgi:methanol metabolism-related c-type cytochrome